MTGTSRYILSCLLVASLVVNAAAANSTQPTTAATVPAQTQPTTQSDTADRQLASIQSGLAYLTEQQNADGSFQIAGTKLQTSALTLLAFLSAGNTPDSGKYGDPVRRVVEFLLRQTPGDRYFGRVDGSGVRGQAIVTLALCEVYGVESDEQTRVRLRATAKDAIAVIIAAQNSKGLTPGGWAAESGNAASDPLVSIWCMIALRAAQQIGLSVPQTNLDRAATYLRNSPSLPPISQPATSLVTHSPEFLLNDLYIPSIDTNPATSPARKSPDWKSAAMQLLATQLPNGSWPTSAESSPTPSPAETAMNVFLLGASEQLLPLWAK